MIGLDEAPSVGDHNIAQADVFVWIGGTWATAGYARENEVVDPWKRAEQICRDRSCAVCSRAREE